MKRSALLAFCTNKYALSFFTIFMVTQILINDPVFSQGRQLIKPHQSGYAPVNGLKMYYEIYGEGKPLLLLLGSFMSSNTNYGHLIPDLSKGRRVIAVEFQGHGRTNDIDRPFALEHLASEC